MIMKPKTAAMKRKRRPGFTLIEPPLTTIIAGLAIPAPVKQVRVKTQPHP